MWEIHCEDSDDTLDGCARLNDNVSIVYLLHLHGSKLFVFKTSLRSIKKTCITSSKYWKTTPTWSWSLLTLSDFASLSVKVGGFILEYYPFRTLRDVLDGGLKPTPVEMVNTDYANIMQHLGGPRPVLLGSQARQSHRLLAGPVRTFRAAICHNVS